MATSDSPVNSNTPLTFDFNFGTSTGKSPLKRTDPSSPMKLLVVADFSNRGAKESNRNDNSKSMSPKKIDIDNFDDLLDQLAPELVLKHPNGASSSISIFELEHFHADHLFTTLPLFAELRELRERLEDSSTFDEAAKQMTSPQLQTATTETEVLEQTDNEIQTTGEDTDLIASMLASESSGGAPSSNGSPLERLIESVVAPHIVPATDPLQSQFVQSVDDSISAQMKLILHNPEFQALEARWLALHTLVTSVETDEDLQIFILDADREQLEAGLSSETADPATSTLARKLSETIDTGKWSVIVSDLSLSLNHQDLILFGKLGQLGSHLGSPFLANAHPSLFGCNESLHQQPDSTQWTQNEGNIETLWQSLRSSRIARWIALASPRYLARLPYGKSTEPTDEFDFEEIRDASEHEHFLWGPASFCCAMKLAHSFTKAGWSMNPDDNLDIDDLPAFTFTHDGEKVLKPCAEISLGESSATEMLSQGVMPLLSHSNRNLIRILRFQSISNPPRALSGPWGES